jgi:1-acyl-sn-glycerol-3-phosphate acyltransferase
VSKPENQFRLLFERRFAPFFVTQLCGAFNDNVFKNSLVILVTYQAASYSALDPNLLTNLAAGIFILPFLLFSASAGQLADKIEKASLIRLIKLVELGIMVLGSVGLFLHNLPLLLCALFLLGLHSTFFGPVKYAILPQSLASRELVGGNGLVEMGTFLAILGGTLLAGILVSLEHGTSWVSAVMIGTAVVGLAASWLIPRAAAPAPDLKFNWNPFSETWRNLGFAKQNRTVFLSLLGISWFWFYGALFLSQFPNYSKIVLGGDEQVVTLLLALFSIGVAMGSLLCERLSGHKVEIGLVPFGSIGLTMFAIDLFFATPPTPTHLVTPMMFLASEGAWRVAFDLFMVGLFGGFYIVPLYALVQTRSEPRFRSRILAANNILNALFMIAASAIAVLMLGAGASITQLLLLTGVLNLGVAIYIYTLVPEFLLRFVDWLLIHSIFRLRTRGTEHLPEEGAALLVCNHQSFADALVLAAACRRPIRFVMYYAIFDIPVLKFIFRSMKAIPIAGFKEDPAILQKAFDDVAQALGDGELVCIFPEGGLTRDGEVAEFKGGFVKILERSPVPVIPMALSGLWKSIFSRHRERVRYAIHWFPTVRLAIGPAMPPTDLTPESLRETVLNLRAQRF